jgi:hypothetical protein
MKGGAQVIPRGLGILMAVLLMGSAQELVAQRGGRGSRADMELRVQARFDNLVREELDLGDDQWRRLQEAVGNFNTRRLEFLQSERGTRARVGRLGGSGGGRELTEEEASAILAEMLELSDQEATLFREEQEALLQILTAPEVVRYIVMRQQQGDLIRNIRGRGGPGPGRQGGRRQGSSAVRPDGGAVPPGPGR